MLLNFIFNWCVAHTDGIDVLEKGRLIGIDAKIFAELFILRSRGFWRPIEKQRVAYPGLRIGFWIGKRNYQLQMVVVHTPEDFVKRHLVAVRRAKQVGPGSIGKTV